MGCTPDPQIDGSWHLPSPCGQRSLAGGPSVHNCGTVTVLLPDGHTAPCFHFTADSRGLEMFLANWSGGEGVKQPAPSVRTDDSTGSRWH